MKSLFSTAIFLFACATIFAQNDKVFINGNVQVEGVIPVNVEMPQSQQNTLVTVYCGDEIVEQFFARCDGNFTYELNMGHQYKVTFSKSGYFEKHLIYDLANTPKSEVPPVVKAKVTLFENDENPQMTELSYTPSARCSYDKNEGAIVWDIDYQQQMNEKYYSLAMQ